MSSTTSSGKSVNEVVKSQAIKQVNPGPGTGSFLGEYYMRILIGPYKRPVPFKDPEWEPSTIVFLPLPTSLSDGTSISYNNASLETVGDFINGAAGGVGAAILRSTGNIITGTAAAAGGIGATALRTGESTASQAGGMAVDAISGYLNNLVQPDQITSAIQQNLAVAPNPNPSVVFQGPELRTYGYTWNLNPRNKKESLAIQRLIKVLKQKALPRASIQNSAAILDYPDMCQVNFYPWDTGGSGQWYWTEDSIIKYKKSVISNVRVDYSNHGIPAFFEDSHLPVSYQLTIEFKEIEYMLSEDWSTSEFPPGSSNTTALSILGSISGEILSTASTVGTIGIEVGATATAASISAAGALAVSPITTVVNELTSAFTQDGGGS